MNIEIVLALSALFVAVGTLLIVFGMASRITRLEHELAQLNRLGGILQARADEVETYVSDYANTDIPAFLRRQAD